MGYKLKQTLQKGPKYSSWKYEIRKLTGFGLRLGLLYSERHWRCRFEIPTDSCLLQACWCPCSCFRSKVCEMRYCWWKQCCTTQDVSNPQHNGTIIIPTGARCLPNTHDVIMYLTFQIYIEAIDANTIDGSEIPNNHLFGCITKTRPK